MKHQALFSCLFAITLLFATGSASAQTPTLPSTALDRSIVAQAEESVELVGQIGGSPTDVILHGDYAYVRVGGGQYRILNVSDPTSPTLVTETDVPLTGVVSTCGKYLYTSNFDRRDITVVDISDPTDPVRVGSAPYDWSGRSRIDMKVSADYLYFLTWYYYNDNALDPRLVLDILDISGPASPVKKGTYEVGTDYPTSDLAVGNDYAYIPVMGDGLHIVDVSNPDDPTKVGVYATDTEDILMEGNHLYTLTWAQNHTENNQLHILDVSDPLTVTELGSCEQPLGPPDSYKTFEWMIEGDHVYVSLDNRLTILDASDPENPTETYLGQLVQVDHPDKAYIQGLDARGDYTYMAYGQGVKDGLYIFNVSDLQNPVLESEYPMLDYRGPVAVKGDYAYIATSQEGSEVLRAVDVSNPHQPTDTGLETTLDVDAVYDMTVNGETLYMAAGKEGLGIWDISHPMAPAEVMTYTRTIYAVAVDNHRLYGSTGSEIIVLDLSDPTQPTEVGSVAFSSVSGLSVRGNHAYIASGEELTIVDITDLDNPTEVGFCRSINVPFDVAVRGDYAYVADFYGGLVVDVSDPENPTRYETYDTPGSANHVTVNEAYIYVDSDFGGIQILRFAPYKIYLPLTIRQSS